MNAPCTLQKNICIRVVEGCKVHLRRPGFLDAEAVLRFGHGNKIGIRSVPGWITVRYPRKAELGLPIEGEKGSWHAAWDDERIQILVHTSSGWHVITDWSEVHDTLIHA